MSRMSDVPDGTVTEVLAWVGDDPDRAEAALEAERLGAGRTTLMSRLEAIADEEDEMADEDTTVDEDAPGPEAPVEVSFDLLDEAVTVGPVHVRDSDVEPAPSLDEDADPEAETLPVEVVQVESFQALSGTNGFAVAINGAETYAFNDQMTVALKSALDQAIAGLAL
jgi:hypothetical protein